MRLNFAVHAVIAATLCNNCIVTSTGMEIHPIKAPEVQQGTIDSPGTDGKRLLRGTEEEKEGEEEEERGFGKWFGSTSKLAPGAEKLSGETMKDMEKQLLKNAGVFDDLLLGKANSNTVFSTWYTMGYTPEMIAKNMKKVVDKPKEYSHIVDGYKEFLGRLGTVRLQ